MTLAVGQGPWQMTVYVLFTTITVTVLMTRMGPLATLRDRTGGPPPEGHLFGTYQVKTVMSYLKKGGQDGVRLYRRALVQDFAFLLLYGAGLVLLLDGTSGRLFRDPGNRARFALDALGAAAALVDVAENAALSHAVQADGGIRRGWIAAANVFTFLKWSFVMASLLVIVTGALLIGLRGTGWL